MHARPGLGRTARFFAFLLAGGAPWLAAAKPAGGQDLNALADDLVKSAGVERGICVLLGCGDGSYPMALARRSELLIHVIDPDAGAVAATRRLLDENRVSAARVIVEQRRLDSLPHADNLIDAVFCVTLTGEMLDMLSAAEIARVLRPRGTAILGRAGKAGAGNEPPDAGKLRRWAADAGAAVVERQRGLGLWVRMSKAVPKQTDDWNHWQHGPDNNPFSDDRVVKAPYLTQFLAEPFHSPMPSISVIAGGRMFRAAGHMAIHEREERHLNTLYATSAHNGTLLWTRPLLTGHLTHRSLFVATPETLYLIQGASCLLLDPQTGRETGRIDPPTEAGSNNLWKWIAIEDGILYALLGGREMEAEIIKHKRPTGAWGWNQLSRGYYTKQYPWGYGHMVAAIDLASKRVLWTRREDKPLDSRAMCMGAGRVFLHSENNFVAALDARTGRPLWKNDDSTLVRTIAEPRDQGLGFKTTPYTVCTDKYLFLAGRGRKNVVGVSAGDGRFLWFLSGAYNATNLLFQGDRLYAHVQACTEIDPLTGKKVRELGIAKRSCARFTGCPDSLFHRGSVQGGEGTTRYDLSRKSPSVIHAFRPPCNDGIIPAGGLLHITPWDCDCNLQLVGTIALCPAGRFVFNQKAAESKRLVDGAARDSSPSLKVSERDWPTFRRDNSRSAATPVAVPAKVGTQWTCKPKVPFSPSVPTAAGGLVFVGGNDGIVRALDAATGRERWRFHTAGPIRLPPTVAGGRAYVGSGDGWVYALDAATGKMAWRFRAAPAERRIPVYGSLCSTWPVNSGVLVRDGVAYAAAGIINYDGTHVYALDAQTGRIRWQNNTSGHLNKEQRCGVSVQGNLTILGDRLWLASGNVTSPAAYALSDGRCLNTPPTAGWPGGQRGSEIAAFLDKYVLIGGRRLYTQDDDPIVNWLGFEVFSAEAVGAHLGGTVPGRVPPAFGNGAVACSGRGPLVCLDAAAVENWIKGQKPNRKWRWQWSAGPQAPKLAPRWKADSIVGSVAVAIAGNVVVAAGQSPDRSRWIVQALDLRDGRPLWTHPLPGAPLPGGLCIDAAGRCILALDSGDLLCLEGKT